MKYHLGTPIGNTFFNHVMLDTKGTGHILFTYAEKRDPMKALETIRKYPEFTIIIDSGAFSVWNSGKSIDRNELLNYYKTLKRYREDLIFINLDVIPGKRGQKPSKAEADAACAAGLDNYYFFKVNGIDTLPVFHEDDNWDYLETFKRETDYIAISPANDSSRQKRILWLDRVYGNLKGNWKTHGLAATAVPLLERYPFYSVDSINWKTSLLYGNGKHYENDITSKLARSADMKYHLLEKDLLFYIKVQKDITDLWARRGIVWKD